MSCSTLESEKPQDTCAAAHIQHALPVDIVRENPFPYEGGRLVITRTEGHLRIDDNLHRHLGAWLVEGCTDEASPIAEEDGLEVVLLPLLIPVDVG